MSLSFGMESNIDEVIAELEAQLAIPHKDHFLEIVNATPYAKYLHDRVGFWVMNDDTAIRYVWGELARAVMEASAAGRFISDSEILDALERAADKIVDAYQAVVGHTDKRGRSMLPPRPVHSGNWASDTTTLVRGYITYVDENPPKEHPWEPNTF